MAAPRGSDHGFEGKGILVLDQWMMLPKSCTDGDISNRKIP